MRYSSLTERIGGEGTQAWEIHSRAVKRARSGEKIIMLSIGDPDFDTPPSIVEACVASLHAGNTHYTAVAGEPALRAAIAAYQQSISGADCTPDQVAVFHGAQNALFSAALCLLQAGDEVIAPEPMYVTYEAVVGSSGATMIVTPCPRETGFHPDLDAMASAVTGRTRAILLNSPNNPTGVVLDAEELEVVADLCRKHDLWLISDEVYATLTFERAHISPCALPGMAERTVTVNSLSKSHAMTGWRVGWTISPPDLIPHLENLALCMHYGCPGFIQDAAAAGLESAPPEVAAMKAELLARRDLVCNSLGGVPGLECLKPDAGMFVMLDVRGTGIRAFDFAAGLLDEHAVSVLPADAFGQSARGHLRLGLCSSQDALADACERIAGFARAI